VLSVFDQVTALPQGSTRFLKKSNEYQRK